MTKRDRIVPKPLVVRVAAHKPYDLPPMARIEWTDAYQDHGKETANVPYLAAHRISIGWCAAENDEAVCLAQTIDFNGPRDGSPGNPPELGYQDYLWIPRGMITKIQRL
jgi:hypothetical protein